MSDAQALQAPTSFPPDQQWMWQGGPDWVNAGFGARATIRVFTASGAYFPSPGVSFVQVECIGGGGAGGAAQSQVAIADWAVLAGGGGGGAGGYSRSLINAAQLRGGVMITVGQGGTPASAPEPVGQAPSGNGGASSFGAMVVATGGEGGRGNVLGNPPVSQLSNWGRPGGHVGTTGVGDFVLIGGNGGQGGGEVANITNVNYALAKGGDGAAGPLMGGVFEGPIVWPQGQGGAGVFDGYGPGQQAGLGGTGGAVAATGVATGIAIGGAGTAGVVIVTEFVIPNPGPGGGVPRPPGPPPGPPGPPPPGPWRPWSEEG